VQLRTKRAYGITAASKIIVDSSQVPCLDSDFASR
jgi:hypothetical protein